MLASDIDLSLLNVEMKGCTLRVKPLYNLYEECKITHWGLNVKFKNEKTYKSKTFFPFYFESKDEAEKACVILNNWSKES